MTKSKRILIFTGNGKGKTTAALGMALRAAGHGMKTLIIQFVKGDPETGEVAACKKTPGIEIIQTGRGFVPRREDPSFEEHRRAASGGLAIAEKAMERGDMDMLVLDEICNAIARGLLAEEDVLAVIGKSAPGISIVLTGRNASAGLVAIADTVTEMRMVKHGRAKGLTARKGVEY